MAKSRRKRAGRSRKAGPRYKGGQLRGKHDRTGPTPEIIERRAEAVGREKALSQHAGNYIGQLFERGILTEAQRDTGYRWQEWQRRYQFLIGGPHQPKATDLDMPRGGPPPDNAEEYRDVRARLLFCYRTVRRRGHNVLRATVHALAGQPQNRLDLVAEGLETLRRALRIGTPGS